MESINRQLQIGLPNRNVNIKNKYALGLGSYQPQLGTTDPDLDYYNDTRSIDEVLMGADGDIHHRAIKTKANSSWRSMGGDRDLSEDYYEAEEDFSNFAYPLCLKKSCKHCKNKCKREQGLKWRKGGKECYKPCKAEYEENELAEIRANTPKAVSETTKAQPVEKKEVIDEQPQGLSAGAKLGIGIGVVAVLGLIGFLALRKR